MARATNFTSSDITEGVNSDRLEIIEIIRQISADDKYRSIAKILIRLNYPRLPIDQTSNDNSKSIIHRLIHFEANSKTKDSISSIKFTDLLARFKERFPGYPKNIIFNYDVIKVHSDYYIYYYESYSDIKEEYFIKFALIGFNKDPKMEEWKNGTIYYLNGDFIIHKKFLLRRIPNKNKEVLFFSASFEDQINFFTLFVNRKNIGDRGIVPLTYSVLETENRLPCAGVGILKKINDNKFIDRIHSIVKKGIEPEIINALYQHKYVLREKVYKKPGDFTTNQMDSLAIVKGIWSGVHLRTDFDETYAIPEKGGICKFVLKIDGSGKCELFWGKEITGFSSYSGFVEFPFAGSSFMKIYLEFLKKEETYKLYVFLSHASKSESEFSYKGVISGWMNNDKKIYTSPFYMKRNEEASNNPFLDIEKILIQENPKRISKSLKDEINKIDPTYIAALQKIEREHVSMFSNCMPSNQEKEALKTIK